MSEDTYTMNVEKKMIRTDIPGHQAYLTGTSAYATPATDGSSPLIIGAGITLNGVISNCDHLIIKGTLEAEDFSGKRLDVMEEGLFLGKATVQDAVIAGTYKGKLIVTGRLIVKATGVVGDDVEYGVIEIENGGRIEGKTAALPTAARSEIIPASNVPSPVAAARRQQLEKKPAAPASNVEKLFGDDKPDSDPNGSRPRVFRKAG